MRERGVCEMLSDQDKTALIQLINKAKEKCQTDYGIDITTQFSVDLNKSLDENKAIIIQQIKSEKELKMKSNPVLAVPKQEVKAKEPDVPKKEKAEKPKSPSNKELKQQQDLAQAKLEAEHLQKMREEEQKVIDNWKTQFKPDLIINSPAYWEMTKHLEMVIKGVSNFSVIAGSGGTAKTYSSHAILNKMSVKYAYYNSYTTAVSFYNFLYDHSQNEIILIDDCEGIWEDKAIVNLLKNATELDGERTISWNTTTSKLEDRANTCKFTSRIILLTNELPSPDRNPHIQALMNRAFVCKLKFSHTELLDVINEVRQKPYHQLPDEVRAEIFEFIKTNTNELNKDLSIRTLIKCYKFYEFDTTLWKDLAAKMLKVDPRKLLVYQLMQSGISVKDQENMFEQKTSVMGIKGGSRAEFYRIKKEIIERA